MKNLKEIEKSLMSLQNDEKISFRKWFIKFDNDSWDTEMESDVKSGKLKILGEKALKEFSEGKAIKM